MDKAMLYFESMKTRIQKRITTLEDDYWTEHIQFFTAQFSSYDTKPQKVYGRIHISEEAFHASPHEIIPSSEKKGQANLCHDAALCA